MIHETESRRVDLESPQSSFICISFFRFKRNASSHTSNKNTSKYSNNIPSTTNFFNPKKFKYKSPKRKFNKNPEQDPDKQLLIEAAANSDANGIVFTPDIALLDAVNRLDAEEVEFLLSRKANPNAADEDGLTALHQACIDNAEDIVKILIKYNADVDCKDSEDWTPLHACITCGHKNIASLLIEAGANLLALNADLSMPYDICDDEGPMLEFIEKNMEAQNITQEDINRIRFEPEKKILDDINDHVKYIKHQYENDNKKIQEVVKHLIDSELPNCTDGSRLIHIAAANGYLQLGLYLLQELSANVNIQDHDGWTAAHAACCWSQQEMLQILSDFNIDFNIRTKLGEKSIDVTDEQDLILFVNKLIKIQRQRKRIKEIEDAKLKANQLAEQERLRKEKLLESKNSNLGVSPLANKSLELEPKSSLGFNPKGSFTRSRGSSRRNRSIRGQAIKKRGTLNASRRGRNKNKDTDNANSNSLDPENNRPSNPVNSRLSSTSSQNLAPNSANTTQNNHHRNSTSSQNKNDGEISPENDDMLARETEAFHEAAYWRGDIKTENDVKKHSIRKRSCRKNLNSESSFRDVNNNNNSRNHNKRSPSNCSNLDNNFKMNEMRTASERLGLNKNNDGITGEYLEKFLMLFPLFFWKN